MKKLHPTPTHKIVLLLPFLEHRFKMIDNFRMTLDDIMISGDTGVNLVLRIEFLELNTSG